MRILRRIGLILAGLLFLAWALASAYYLPAQEKVQITGTEVKREDFTRADGTRDSHDVRYIMATNLEGRVRAYRNEDTGWGFPPYFKFNSGDLAAQASAIARNQQDAVVLVRAYGRRVPIASLYPNALSLRIVDPEYEPFPAFVFAYLAACFSLLVVGYLAFLRLRRWRPFRKEPTGEDGSVGSEVSSASDPDPDPEA